MLQKAKQISLQFYVVGEEMPEFQCLTYYGMVALDAAIKRAQEEISTRLEDRYKADVTKVHVSITGEGDPYEWDYRPTYPRERTILERNGLMLTTEQFAIRVDEEGNTPAEPDPWEHAVTDMCGCEMLAMYPEQDIYALLSAETPSLTRRSFKTDYRVAYHVTILCGKDFDLVDNAFTAYSRKKAESLAMAWIKKEYK